MATGIYYIGRDESGARKKVWMFMQGMVRGAPDLAVWQHAINSADLGVPLDTNTGAAFLDLRTPYLERLLHDNDLSYELDERGKMASTAGNIEAVTRVARWLFSKDPARVDYAFFCCGRHHSPGSDHHRCWTYVNCSACSLRSLVRCKERRA
nr:DUF2400 family protein [Deinobacterium chartae]